MVCTEEAEIHYTSEVTPYVEARIWDDSDIPALARMTERVHDCGALACIELAYNGLDGSNLHSRVVPQAPSALPVISGSHPSGAGPGTVAGAVWEGRRYAEELEAPTDDSDITPYRREIAAIAP